MQTEEKFYAITEKLCRKYEHVEAGKMMNSPAIKANGKVFAFYHKNAMTFKLNEQVAFYKEKYIGSSYLSPFKNKPPMKGWLSIPEEYNLEWERLSIEAMKTIL